jgi:hypothetical protein
MFKLRAVFVYALILLAACTNQPQSGNTNLTIGVTTNLSSYRSTIYHCAQASMQSVKVDALPLERLLQGEYNAILQIGQPEPDRVFPFQVGEASLVFIINPQNPLSQIKPSQLAAIFLGMLDDWQKLAPANFSSPRKINIWSYPVGDDVRRMVESVLLNGRQITPRGFNVPDEKAMIEAVNNDPAAIGFLLNIHPQSEIKSLQIVPAGKVTQAQPVIASFITVPEGYLKDLMVCLSKQGE